MSSPLRVVLENEHRLDLLCCLEAEGPMTVHGLSETTGKSLTAVAFFLDALEEHGVIRESGQHVGQEPLYEACLDEHPAWVRKAVERHCRGG
jgi:DNA-binding transcriptional ArsR family regulator